MSLLMETLTGNQVQKTRITRMFTCFCKEHVDLLRPKRSYMEQHYDLLFLRTQVRSGCVRHGCARGGAALKTVFSSVM